MKIRALTTATVIAISLLVPANIALASDEPASGDTSSVQANTEASEDSANNLAAIVSAATAPELKTDEVPAVESADGSFVKSGQVEVTIPLDASEPVGSTLATADGDLTINVGTGADAEISGVLSADGSVVYDPSDSTAHTVQATTSGFRIHTVLEDNTAPTEITHDLTLPAGAKLVAAKDMPQSADAPAPEGAIFVVDATGTTIGAFMSAWAKDANGKDVATHYEIRDGNLVQIVEHHAAGIAYPVVADPQFGWVGWFPVLKFNRYETATASIASNVLHVCGWAGKWSPISLWACAISAVQISIQAVIANARRECIQLAPAPIGAMAFRYTGGYCR
ncbi:hypothetical protein [Pseudarthrobacter albicanus]|uniref:hypothetical protein n=1 Tax=Pseudarthrobacter albicanus TaxID=2823873 RepID=UPI001BA482A5|nr:hypothetical protein [Pseudarthrobacter albicanus]